MLMTLVQLRTMFSSNVSKARSIERVINSSRFQAAWEASSDSDRFVAQNICGWLDYQKLGEWVEQHEKKQYAEMSVTKLKRIARKRGIPYYGSKTKAQLLSDIISEEKHEETGNDRQDGRNAGDNGADAGPLQRKP